MTTLNVMRMVRLAIVTIIMRMMKMSPLLLVTNYTICIYTMIGEGTSVDNEDESESNN
jgi:hypothetical protein